MEHEGILLLGCADDLNCVGSDEHSIVCNGNKASQEVGVLVNDGKTRYIVAEGSSITARTQRFRMWGLLF